MALKFRRPLIALCGVGGMVIGLFAVSVSDRFPLPFNIVFIVVGMIGAVTGGLVFGVVAVAWVMKQAVQLSETSQWGRFGQRWVATLFLCGRILLGMRRLMFLQ